MRIDSLPFVSSLSPRKSFVHSQPGRTGLFRLSTWLCVAALAVFASTAAMAQVRDYSTIVVFGDSLSDTGNVTHLAYETYMIPVPGPYLNYTLGRFTDGPDRLRTLPITSACGSSSSLPRCPAIRRFSDSLDGGTDYAYGYATTANGPPTLLRAALRSGGEHWPADHRLSFLQASQDRQSDVCSSSGAAPSTCSTPRRKGRYRGGLQGRPSIFNGSSMQGARNSSFPTCRLWGWCRDSTVRRQRRCLQPSVGALQYLSRIGPRCAQRPASTQKDCLLPTRCRKPASSRCGRAVGLLAEERHNAGAGPGSRPR